MDTFKVEFSPSALDALRIALAALQGKRVALCVRRPVVEQTSDTTMVMRASQDAELEA